MKSPNQIRTACNMCRKVKLKCEGKPCKLCVKVGTRCMIEPGMKIPLLGVSHDKTMSVLKHWDPKILETIFDGN
jgi:hypothetical protein